MTILAGLLWTALLTTETKARADLSVMPQKKSMTLIFSGSGIHIPRFQYRRKGVMI